MYINGIREAKHKTKVRQNTQDPVWNQACIFDINRENPKLLGHVFVFHIIHKDMMMGVQKVGQVILEICQFKNVCIFLCHDEKHTSLSKFHCKFDIK